MAKLSKVERVNLILEKLKGKITVDENGVGTVEKVQSLKHYQKVLPKLLSLLTMKRNLMWLQPLRSNLVL